ncbi:efflux RND transporter permease subunit [Zavarzinia sp. CC-PAN008]|uniref:efflux RND transporter permease subunit n=1 Tax=Zavarzinia sp. CC-PAN008 TaxID=3243332 RepID=UPI003F7493A1
MMQRVENFVFRFRAFILMVLFAVTVVMFYMATGLRMDAGFTKQLPIGHDYIDTYFQYQDQFAGANRVLIVLEAKDGTIFTPDYLRELKAATDDLFFIPGVARGTVSSLWTANTRFFEITEDGIRAGDVIPPSFSADAGGMELARTNILKAGLVGRMVANDFSASMITAELQDIDPETRRRLDYFEVAKRLEENIRQKYENDKVSVKIIGFAKLMGDIADGAKSVVFFFAIAFVLTVLMLYLYCRSWTLTFVTLTASLCSLGWQFGLLYIFDFGLDPLAVLVPFLVFAIGVSHGVQQINMIGAEIANGKTKEQAARDTFSFLFLPGSVALLTCLAGFGTLYIIPIGMIQELAITASIGVALKIISNLLMLPLLASYIAPTGEYARKVQAAMASREKYWPTVAKIALPRNAFIFVGFCAMLSAIGIYVSRDLQVGDTNDGAAELWPNSRYNTDTRFIVDNFNIGVDLLTVVVETPQDTCVERRVMNLLDRFQWEMANVEGVQAAIGLPLLAKQIGTLWREGNLKWRVLPRNSDVLSQAINPISTSSGAFNQICTVMPLQIFLRDHRAETINRVVHAVEAFRDEHKLHTEIVGLINRMPGASDADKATVVHYAQQALILTAMSEFLDGNRESFQRFGLASDWLTPELDAAVKAAPADSKPVDVALATLDGIVKQAGDNDISRSQWNRVMPFVRTQVDNLPAEIKEQIDTIMQSSTEAKRARVAAMAAEYIQAHRVSIETGDRNFATTHPLDAVVAYLRTPGEKPAILEQAADYLSLPETKSEAINVRLASGNVGIMAATNEVVAKSELPMLLYVYGVVIALVLLTYREWRGSLCCVLPLIVSTIIGNWFLTWMGLGLKIATLPVLAIAVGIGVDYGIYEYNRIQRYMRAGKNPHQAYLQALKDVGSATMFTGFTLAVGVSTWSFSELKFQADMGMLLTFMFMVNMIGAVTLLPALIAVIEYIWPGKRKPLSAAEASIIRLH